jgi:ABC-type phosphate transport system substrate-binding protein
MTPTWRARITAAAGAGAVVALASLGIVPTPAEAGNYVSISGSGSSWASVAIDQWSQDVRKNGIVVNYNANGSAAGRSDYSSNQDDFAGSDPPFRDGLDKLGGTGAEHPSQGYSYIPDTAGGTALIYHISVAGHLIRNLRLDSRTIFDIFTGRITNWADKRITHIYGARLPSLPITPVIRSDGSGATFFFTKWMASLYPSDWNAFCRRVHPSISMPCGNTEFYPQFGNAKAENGSNNVMTYITSSFGNGSIGYDEYAYALNSRYPVVQVLNPAHYFVGPTASNVAVALTKAIINENEHSRNFLQQDLHKLYSYKDPRNYPISSYSYLIVPRSGTPQPTNFSTAKGRTLSTFVNFMLCAGQGQMRQLGYSPLPKNLVQGGLVQNGEIPGNVSLRFNQLRNCHNPTMQNGRNILLATAPFPGPCQKLGAPLHCVVKNGKAVATGSSASGGNNGGGSGQNGGSSSGGGGGTTGTGTAAGTGTATGATGPVTGVVVNLAGDHSNQAALGALTALGIVLAVALPPALAVWMRRRRGQARG